MKKYLNKLGTMLTIIGFVSFSIIIPILDSKIKKAEYFKNGLQEKYNNFSRIDFQGYLASCTQSVIMLLPQSKLQRHEDSIKTVELINIMVNSRISIASRIISPKELEIIKDRGKNLIIQYLVRETDANRDQKNKWEKLSKRKLIKILQDTYNHYTPSKEEINSWRNQDYEQYAAFAQNIIMELTDDYNSFAYEARKLENQKKKYLYFTVLLQAIGLFLSSRFIPMQ